MKNIVEKLNCKTKPLLCFDITDVVCELFITSRVNLNWSLWVDVWSSSLVRLQTSSYEVNKITTHILQIENFTKQFH